MQILVSIKSPLEEKVLNRPPLLRCLNISLMESSDPEYFQNQIDQEHNGLEEVVCHMVNIYGEILV